MKKQNRCQWSLTMEKRLRLRNIDCQDWTQSCTNRRSTPPRMRTKASIPLVETRGSLLLHWERFQLPVISSKQSCDCWRNRQRERERERLTMRSKFCWRKNLAMPKFQPLAHHFSLCFPSLDSVVNPKILQQKCAKENQADVHDRVRFH
jgi:hypothetical protein